jgi:hypothetical protein
MAAEIQLPYTASGASLYAIVRDIDGAVYNGSAFETYEADHYVTYVIALAEQGTSRYYVAGFPGVGEGIYRVAVFLQAGGAPIEGDAPVDDFTLEWTGAQQLELTGLFEVLFELLPSALTDGGMQSTVIEIASGVSSALADTILDRAAGVESGITLRQALRLILAAVAGPLSGADTSSVTIKAADNSKTRIVASVDAIGNRTSVSLDPT